MKTNNSEINTGLSHQSVSNPTPSAKVKRQKLRTEWQSARRQRREDRRLGKRRFPGLDLIGPNRMPPDFKMAA